MPAGPSWDDLYALAAAQAGHFTTSQAHVAGFSSPLLHKHLASGRIERIRRGIYRLVHFPSSDEEGLVVFWLWSDRKGVFSHETALARHALSDVLPHRVEMTVPVVWRARRLRVPDGLDLHYADLPRSDWTWFGPVPLTTAARTIRDCMAAGVSPEFTGQAVEEGLRRGLFERDEIDASGGTP